MKLEFNCLCTGIGSMPHIDADFACALINKYLSVPHWPQLPKRSATENMYIQFSEGFPCIKLENEKITFQKTTDFDERIEKLYSDHSNNKYEDYLISAEYAAGLYKYLDINSVRSEILKGQITGPISWGLSVTDEKGRGILYDELLGEIIAKFLCLKAMWQERILENVSKNTIIFVDEPYLSSLGSAFVAISNKLVTTYLETVLSGIRGIKGIHCCGGTDWSLLFNTSINILSFDAYNYSDSLTTYSDNVISFIRNGGVIAWGIVPNDEEILEHESVSTIFDRLCESIGYYTYNDVNFKQIVSQSLITPSCGLATLSVEASEQVLAILKEVSDRMRKKYVN